MEPLFEEYNQMVYSLSCNLTKNREEADNVFQETWLQVARHIHQLDQTKNPKNWLYTICLNCFRQLYNQDKRKRSFVKAYSSEEAYDYELENMTDNERTVEEQLTANERKAYLRQVINQLNELYRVPIIMFYFENLSYNEISEILDLPLTTLKYRLHRGKKLIKTEMEDYQNESD